MTEKGNRTFEETLGELEEIIAYLDSGNADLDGSLAKYEEGVRLLRQCRKLLDAAQQKIEILRAIDPETGEIETEPVNLDELRSDESSAGRGKTAGRGRRAKSADGEADLL